MRREEIEKKSIGSKIYQYRDSLGINRVKFMSDIGNIPVSLSNIENGRSYPSLDFLVAVSNQYRVAISELVDTGFRQTDVPEINIGDYGDQELYYILQKISMEKYSGLRNHEMNEFVSIGVVDSNWSFMGKLLHNERVKGKFTYQYLSEQTGIRMGTIRNIESGSNSSSFRVWYQICSALKIPMDYFLVNRLTYKQGALAFLIEDIFEKTTEDERMYLIKYTNLYGEIYRKIRKWR